MKNKITTLLIFLIPFVNFAQKITVKGRVIDAVSKEGLPSCNVMINSTSIGQSTNLDGFYQISNIDFKEFELVYRYVGYETTLRKVSYLDSTSVTIDVELKPSQNLLTEVEVKSKRDKKWEKQLKTFKNHFFGYSDFAKKCDIENAWILDFEDTSDGFTAKANQTLKVLNPALGYTMYFDIQEYIVSKDSYKIKSNVSFTEMNPPTKAKFEEWLNNRKEAYKKSPSYFLKTVANNELKAKGFQLYVEKPGSNANRSDDFELELGKSVMEYESSKMVGLGKKPGQKKIYITNNLEIHHQNTKSPLRTYQGMDYGISWMNVRNNNIFLDENNNILNTQDLIVSGDMDYLRVSGLLPLNYDANITANEAYFLNFEKPTFSETVHLHTDRSSYYVSDKIWFKAYLNYSSFATIDTTSKVLNVELYDQDRKNIIQQKLEINEGYAYGQVQIPSNAPTGTYTLRAYTNYMLNFEKNMTEMALPVLALNSKIKHDENNEETIIDALNIDITEDQAGLNVSIKNKANKPLESNFSISLTNPKYSPSAGSTIIKDLALPKQKLKTPLKYKKEIGLEINGILMDKKKKPYKADFSIWANNLANMTEGSTDANGNFEVKDLNFYDEADIFIKVKGKKNIDNVVILKPNSSATPPYKTAESSYETEVLPEKIFTEVLASKIDTAAATTKEYKNEVKQIYGRPDYVLYEKDIIKTNGTQGVVNSLTGRVPSLRYTPAGFILRGGTSSFTGSRIALMLIDGVPNNNFGSIDPVNILKIEVVSRMINMYGDQGNNGLISIFMKSSKSKEEEPVDKNTVKLSQKGFASPQIFQTAEIKMAKNENPPTIYWSPEVLTDKNGNAKIELQTPQKPYRVTIEGITQNNVPFKREFLIK
jgi:hypothetical protein